MLLQKLFILTGFSRLYFIDYKENKEIRPLCILFAEMSVYKRYSDKTMYFMIKEKKNLRNI